MASTAFLPPEIRWLLPDTSDVAIVAALTARRQAQGRQSARLGEFHEPSVP
jgi:hypothetical protein